MSVRRGFVVRMQRNDTTTVYLKPDGSYSVDLLNARVYAKPEDADPDLPQVKAYANATSGGNYTVDVRACTMVASLG